MNKTHFFPYFIVLFIILICKYIDSISAFVNKFDTVSTIGITIVIFIFNLIYVEYNKNKHRKLIISELDEIRKHLSCDIQFFMHEINRITLNNDNTNKVLLGFIKPTKYSIKLEKKYLIYCDIINKFDVDNLDDLYYINLNYIRATEYLKKYILDKNKDDIIFANTIISQCIKDIKLIKFKL